MTLLKIILLVISFVFIFIMPLLVAENLGTRKGFNTSIITYIIITFIFYLSYFFDNKNEIIFTLFLLFGIPVSFVGTVIGGIIRIFTHPEEEDER